MATVFPLLLHEADAWAVLPNQLGGWKHVLCSGRKKFVNVYVFLEGNELNIAFQFVILMLQNYIQRNKL